MSRTGLHERGSRDRAQMVLVAAAVVALAIVPVAFAYLQLGYHADVRASAEYDDPARDAQRVLQRAVHGAAMGVPANHTWANRSGAADAVRADLGPRLRTLAASRVTSGTAYQVAYNRTAAGAWAGANCPGGPNRQFGACEAIRGVVVQNRTGEATPLAVGLDLTVITERGRTELTLVVRVVTAER